MRGYEVTCSGWPIIQSAFSWRAAPRHDLHPVTAGRAWPVKQASCCCQMPARSELRLDLSSAECRGPGLAAPKVDCRDFMIAQAKQVHAF